ncbi:MAG: tetratricopeptide repeat protein [Proteobacteria bacterium]|nr:tetratricopeptide repeat protein [Pseudomonadota bacterium]
MRDRIANAGHRPALNLLNTWSEAMRELSPQPSDSRWGDLWLTRAKLCFLTSDYEGATRWASKSIRAAEEHGWHHILNNALFQRAQVALRRAELVDAETDLLRLKHAVSSETQALMMGKALFGLAAVARYRQDYDKSFLLYGEACRNFNQVDNREGAASCWRDMAALELTLSNPKRADILYRRAFAIYQALGKRHEMANCVNGIAEVARRWGELDEAKRGYNRALELYESVGGGQVVIPRMNLALICLRQRDFAQARRTLENVRLLMAQQGRRHILASAHLGLVACDAGLNSWESFDKNLQIAETLRDETGLAEPDCGWMALLAGDVAMSRGQLERAARVWEFAIHQYEAVEDQKSVAEVQQRLDQLD